MPGQEREWESVYVEKVICCQRVAMAGFEYPGDKKERGPKYGNTCAERHFAPGDHTKGRWICQDCPTTKIGRMTVFPTICERAEAKEGV